MAVAPSVAAPVAEPAPQIDRSSPTIPAFEPPAEVVPERSSATIPDLSDPSDTEERS
jgi:hypothetical protein